MMKNKLAAWSMIAAAISFGPGAGRPVMGGDAVRGLAAAARAASSTYGEAELVGTYGDVNYNAEKKYLDHFVKRLQESPHAKGVILVCRRRSDPPRVAEARANRAREYVLYDRLLSDDRVEPRIGRMRGDKDGELTRLYIAQPNDHITEPGDCEVK
jgi:hypothetical protein